MKKILLSLGVIAVVGVVIAGATGAFYNDTETSNGNIFTAGSIDLKVDHTKQTYNGVDCKTCSVTLVSDTSNMVVAKNGVSVTPYPAVFLNPTHPAWTAQNDPALATAGAEWIWEKNPVKQEDTIVDTTYTFRKTFTWMGPVTSSDLTMAVGHDNTVEVWLNGVNVGNGTDIYGFEIDHMLHIPGASIVGNILQGNNVLEIKLRNRMEPNGNPENNPAGLIYKFEINGNCGDAYFQNQCHLWSEKDLGPNDSFFQFNDVKPGDFGTDVISLHVYDNDAYACLIVGNKNDEENPAQPLGPELSAGDVLGVGNPTGKGELSNFLNVFTWGDTDGDGVYDTNESSLGSGPLSSLSSIMSMDSLNQQFLVATTTKNIGLAWCAGTLTPNQGGAFGCNGAGMGNIAQSDSFSASLTAYAEQVRNNGTFSCGHVSLPVAGGDTGGDVEGGQALGPKTLNLGAVVGVGVTGESIILGDSAIVAETAITDANPSVSAVTGNVVINSAAGTFIPSLSCSQVTGKIYNDGGYTGGWNSNIVCEIANPVIALATRLAMEAAYIDVAGRPIPDGFNLYGGNIGGKTFTPGLYKWTTGVTIPTDVTLSGDANDIWIFQVSGDLSIASAMKVNLIGGALAKNVFWQVGGSTGATLGTTSTFEGTILSAKQIIIQSGAVLHGRALSQTQVTLSGNTVTLPN